MHHLSGDTGRTRSKRQLEDYESRSQRLRGTKPVLLLPKAGSNASNACDASSSLPKQPNKPILTLFVRLYFLELLLQLHGKVLARVIIVPALLPQVRVAAWKLRIFFSPVFHGEVLKLIVLF